MRLAHRSDSPSVMMLVLVLVLGFCAFALVACSSSDQGAPVTEPDSTSTTTAAQTTVGESAGGAGEGEVVLEVVGPTGTRSYTMAEIKALPVTQGYGGMKSSTGRITPPTMVKGVLVEDLFAEVGGAPADMAVGIMAKDGYEMTVSVAQLQSGRFLTYDMATGDEFEYQHTLQALVAYEIDGQPIDPTADGPLRLAIVSSERNQVTDGHWWVKWVTRLATKPVEQEWSLLLTGAITEDMDRGTFETGAAEGCHGQDWTDAEGNTWTGIPLYLLVGRVDDENVHEGPAYNRDLAQAGYEVEIVTSGSGTVTLPSETMYYNKQLLVAYRMNGAELPEEFWPLRLVGEGIEDAQMVGGIGEIKAILPTQ